MSGRCPTRLVGVRVAAFSDFDAVQTWNDGGVAEQVFLGTEATPVPGGAWFPLAQDGHGYHGLIRGDFVDLAAADVASILREGGTMLGSARSKEFMTVAGRDRARSHLRERGIAGLVVIGGNGSLAGATALTDPAEAGDDFRCTVTGVPASIDNDIGLTGMAIGVDTAMNTIVEACDKISDTASAHDRTFMRDEDELHDKLRAAHKEVMGLIAGVSRTRDVKDDVKAVVAHLGTEDRWFSFRAAADALLKAYGTLSPDPRVLPYQRDLKFVAAVLPYGRLHFEKVEETDWKRYSEKIRAMLDEHLEVTGLKTVCKLRSLSDPAFWGDFGQPEDLATAAVRKLAELKKETSERASQNAARYERFSDRIKALIKAFSAGLIDAAKVLDETEALAREIQAEDEAHVGSGLNERAYGVAAILETFEAVFSGVAESEGPVYGGEAGPLSRLQQAAADIDALYASEASAPPYWQDKAVLKKELRGQVRRIVRPLGLDGWQQRIPLEVEHYAVLHYSKP